jgi:GMP synthase (glutamine-hydrolysing)
MKLLIVDNAEKADKGLNFNFPLIETVSKAAEYEVAHYEEVDENYVSMRKYGGIILSGVPIFYPVEVIDERATRLEWFKYISIPGLGICLGHQSIGRVFGASIIENLEAEAGPVSLQKQPLGAVDPLLANINNLAEVEALHRCSITLPGNFVQIASSPACKNQVMRHENMPLYGMQSHPERSLIGVSLLRNFVQIAHDHQKQPGSLAI